MRRFLLLVVVSCTAGSVLLSLMPRQLGAYLAMFSQHTSVNRGVAVTVLGVLILLLVALRVRLWRSERELARSRRGREQPPAPPYPYPYPPPPWGSRPAR
jgi:membrane protein DedA with SNARE-associated domain